MAKAIPYVAAALLALLGCESSPPRVISTTSSAYPARGHGDPVQVFTGEQRPENGYDEIGIVRPAGSFIEMSFNEALEGAKASARAQGGDVVIYRGSNANAKHSAFDSRPLTIYEFVIGRARPEPRPATPAAPVVASPAPAGTAAPTTATFCPSCGARYADGSARFCASCGGKRATTDAPPIAAATAPPAPAALSRHGQVLPGPTRYLWAREDRGPDARGERATVIMQGSPVTVLEDKGPLLRVSSRGAEGWIEAAAVERAP